MSRYELYLLLHVFGAIVWVGAHACLQFLALRAERAGDADALKRVLDDGDALAKIIIPSALVVVAMGVLMVVDGPWSFSTLWIDLGLGGFAITFLTGMLLLDPAGKRLAAVVEADGGWGPAALAQAGRLLAVARADALVLVLVVCVMVTKPTGDDGVLLAVLAAILLGGAGYAITRTRSIAAAPLPATD